MVEYLCNLIKKIKKMEFIRSISTLVSGNVVAQIIGLFSVPIVSRLYSQEAFGEFNIIISAGAIVTTFATIGLTSAIMVPKEETKAQDVFYTAFITQFVISTVFLIISLLLVPYIHFFTTDIPYQLACILLYIYIILSNTSALLSTYVNRQKKYKVLFWNSLIGALATLFITLPLGLLGWGSIGFIVASIGSLFAANAQMLLRVNPFKKFMNFKEMFAIIKEFKGFITYQFPSNLISNFTTQLPNQMFAASFGNIALGGYAMCQRLLGVPINFIGAPVGTVYFRTATQYYEEGKDLAEFTFALISRVMMVAFIPLVILISYGDKLFIFILGNKWEEAGVFASILVLQYVLMFCNQCTSGCRVAINRQNINLLMSVIQLIMIGFSICIGLFIFKNLFSTIVCFAVGNTTFQALNLIINFYCMKKRLLRFIVFTIVYIITSLLIGFGLRSYMTKI